ncbi:MAG: pentapeptide repeat-containing protein [Okeania sp. SIO2C9]|uniref:pentapeptide repeat-containing protein n=1 Tax=Okeania sp. SIO2C9 TaxID=2607791 RepID=UPI0013C14783|nr:pentapeptide repeat-containing protein [Okeania sp. SIO2C9]NEQ77761.1 pentapeptide repeat-containing protein [Okeania sp. SIO2C9]
MNNEESNKENNNQIIQGDKNIIIQVNNNHSTADASEKIPNPKEEKNIALAFIITGSLNITHELTLKVIEKHLQKIADDADDAELTIVDVDEGSLKFVLQGSPEGLERIEKLFNSEELTEIFDVPIKNVEFIEPEKEKLAFSITGDISYTDVAKIKAAVTGVDEKELLIQKIRTYRGSEKLNLSGADLSGADLSGADLSGADFSGADLSGADLSGVDLSGAILRGAYLSGAILRGAYLTEADLSGAYLRKAILNGADLRKAILSGAILSGAYLTRAILSGAYLSGAYLEETDLSGADLTEADLSGAYLRKAILNGAILRGAYLTRAILSGAKLENSKVINAKFSSNSQGINEQLKQDLIQQGAIFEDS